MPKMKPNAGPWSFECALGGVTIKDAKGKAVAQARLRKDGWNAELLAAAPELLDVVDRYTRACRAHLPDHLQQAFCGILASADEAISKARGRTPQQTPSKSLC